MPPRILRLALPAILLVSYSGCAAVEDTHESVVLALAAAAGSLTDFDRFHASVYREPFQDGVYIVNGDTPIANEKQLREFHARHIAAGAGENTLIVMRANGMDAAWDASRKNNLTYCVSTDFGSRHGLVTAEMNAAAQAWESAANLNFIHLAEHDGDCTARNENVLFDVRPVNTGGGYLARAFFPNYGRSQRNILIDDSAFELSGNANLTGILRHELGHALGFRHEHTRPESGACFEDSLWRPLTPYDSDSVMHYPQCNGTGDWSLALTEQDRIGVARLYGEPSDDTGGTPPMGTETRDYSGDLARGEDKYHGPFIVESGSVFRAALSGTGDGDLYVRYGAAPDTWTFDCRPYLTSSKEECSLTVPDGETRVHIMVRGYRAANYNLRVTYKPGTETDTGGVRETRGAWIARGQIHRYGPFSSRAGTTFLARMTGRGDADLYVRRALAPATADFDCRPYKWSSFEFCALPPSSGDEMVYVMVRGWRNAIYELELNYTRP